MSLRNTVKRQVKLAFRQIGDLKTTVIFTKQQNSSFNFGTGNAEAIAGTPVILNGVFVEKKTSPDSKSLEKGKTGSLFFIEDEVVSQGGIESYDLLEFQNKQWKVTAPVKMSDYLVEVQVACVGA